MMLHPPPLPHSPFAFLQNYMFRNPLKLGGQDPNPVYREPMNAPRNSSILRCRGEECPGPGSGEGPRKSSEDPTEQRAA